MTFPMHIVAVGGLVTDNDENILLVKHPRRGWEFPGGIVEVGESLPQALIREIIEESGIVARIENIIGIYSNTAKRKGYNDVKEIPTIVNVDFICSFVSGKLSTSKESTESGWFSKQRALKLVTDEYIFYRLKNMIEYNGNFHCDALNLPFMLTEQYLLNR